MNCFIYDENGDLKIIKNNGLKFSIDRSDKPELGFEYDILIYADEEFKVVNYDPDRPMEEQILPLEDVEKDSIEEYILTVIPPTEYSLNKQYVEELTDMIKEYEKSSLEYYGFNDVNDCLIAGREGSNHPLRVSARQHFEFCDVLHTQFEICKDQISTTHEDNLRDMDFYRATFPSPYQI